MLRYVKTGIVLLMVGCPLISGIIGMSGSRAGVAKPKFHVAVLTPGTAYRQTVKTRTELKPTQGTSGAQLPNYRGESLTLGLLRK